METSSCSFIIFLWLPVKMVPSLTFNSCAVKYGNRLWIHLPRIQQYLFVSFLTEEVIKRGCKFALRFRFKCSYLSFCDMTMSKGTVKGERFSWVQLSFSSYNRCLRSTPPPPFLHWPPGFIGYVIDARDLQLVVMQYFFVFWNSDKVTANNGISETLATAFYQRSWGNNFLLVSWVDLPAAKNYFLFVQ